MEYRIQSLVLPTEEKHRGCRKLFYRGSHGILDTKKQSLSLGYGQGCDFVTYLNACSWQKWQKYTTAAKLTLHLDIEGDVELTFLGYSKEALTVDRKEFDTKTFHKKSRREIIYTFPDNDEMMVGFEISALSKCTIHGGYYTVEVKKSDINNVTLSLATTTCNKEDFIKKNVAIIKQEIISSDEEIAKNFYLHVVDNGRTLTEKDIYGSHVYLHSNINAGGAGGFARGMIESLAQKPMATHILLMDDDVLILSESIKRTFNILKLLRSEYHNTIISGAMLYYEKPEFQHEDIGTVSGGFNFRALKGQLNQSHLDKNLENEKLFTQHKNSYAGWWYCCLPASIIRKEGLPLPIFIRCDDMEYGIRCKVPFITMNGICVWHMGFVTKYNAAFDKYQQHRNLLIAKAASGILDDIDIPKAIYDSFRTEIMRFNYDTAQLIVEALEDYMKGPKYLETVDGEKLTKEHFKLNDRLTPLRDLPDGNTFRPKDSYEAPQLTFKNRVLIRLTWNGQRLTPKFLEKPGVVPIGFDWALQIQRIAMHSKLIAVNPYNETGVYRIKNKKRFRELMHRYNRAMHDYKRRGDAVRKAYADEAKYMTSEKFWRKYLGIEDGKK